MARKATGRKGPARKAAGKKAAPAEPRKKTAAAAPAKRKAAPATTRKAAAKKAAPARKAVAKAARKAAPKVAPKAAAVKRAAPRKVTSKVTRKAAVAPAVRRKVAAKRTSVAVARKAAPQVFTVSHMNEADFKHDGLRPYALYRDLGIAAATSGLCQAHVIRMIPPCTDEVRKRHTHSVELQLVYVLKGWIKNEFEGYGEQMMSQGTCWIQPPNIKHTVLDYSADFEGLEIIIPADFGTTEVA